MIKRQRHKLKVNKGRKGQGRGEGHLGKARQASGGRGGGLPALWSGRSRFPLHSSWERGGDQVQSSHGVAAKA